MITQWWWSIHDCWQVGQSIILGGLGESGRLINWGGEVDEDDEDADYDYNDNG